MKMTNAFCLSVKDLQDEWAVDPKQRLKLKKLIPFLKAENKELLYQNIVCVSKTFAYTLMDNADDLQLG